MVSNEAGTEPGLVDDVCTGTDDHLVQDLGRPELISAIFILNVFWGSRAFMAAILILDGV